MEIFFKAKLWTDRGAGEKDVKEVENNYRRMKFRVGNKYSCFFLFVMFLIELSLLLKINK